MASIDYLHKLAGLNSSRLSRQENHLLDTYLLCKIVQEIGSELLKITHGTICSKYSHGEIKMTNQNVIGLILRDLIHSNEYTMAGIAIYSDIPEDVLYDIMLGNNLNPSINVTRKIIELHKSARSHLYKHVINKILRHDSGKESIDAEESASFETVTS